MDQIARVRSFNRTVTQHIGALDTRFLGRSRSLGASRLLFEIGAEGSEVRRLRDRLSLDSGYTSRLLRGLEREGLIRTEPAAADARVRLVRLTAAGHQELALLDQLSDNAARVLLERLSESQRTELATAMASVERLLLSGSVRLEVVDPSSEAAQHCLDRYFHELAQRFEAGFDPARSISADAEELTPPRGYFVLATLHGRPAGCGALKCHEEFAEVKRMWTDPDLRGLGIARRILQQLEEIARDQKIPLLRLETNRTLSEAQAMYRRHGYREVPAFNQEPYAHHWFEKTL
jgi:DNA-binding MarR family transcriptional regulator/GNAT superfamily N-acetyltransferase